MPFGVLKESSGQQVLSERLPQPKAVAEGEADAGALAAAEVYGGKQGLDMLELPRREGVSGGTKTTSGWLLMMMMMMMMMMVMIP